MKSKKYRGEVIEIYAQEGRAAVRFSFRGRDRVECVNLHLGPDASSLELGQKGWMTFTITPSMGVWGFTPFKGNNNNE